VVPKSLVYQFKLGLVCSSVELTRPGPTKPIATPDVLCRLLARQDAAEPAAATRVRRRGGRPPGDEDRGDSAEHAQAQLTVRSVQSPPSHPGHKTYPFRSAVFSAALPLTAARVEEEPFIWLPLVRDYRSNLYARASLGDNLTSATDVVCVRVGSNPPLGLVSISELYL